MSDASQVDERDAITAHELREQGSLKWTKFGEAGPDGTPGSGDMIGLFVAEMDFGTAPAVVQALHAAVDRGSFGYLPPALARDLSTACARWQRQRYGWVVPPEQIYPVAGVVPAFELAMHHLARPGSPIILPTPAYMPFLTIPPLYGREVIEVPMVRDGDAGRYRLDLDGIDRAFRDGGHLLVLCNPANPVGRVLTADELAAVSAVVDRHGGRVFADEVHAPLVYPDHRHVPYAATSATAAAHTLTATSASKAWNLAGLGCAQVIVAEPDTDTWHRIAQLPSTMATPLGAIASAAAYRAGGPWLDGVVTYLDRSRQVLRELLATHLPQVRYVPPEGTYLAWLDFTQLAGVAEAAEAAEAAGQPLDAFFRDRAGVALVDGTECGRAGRGHVRLNFALPLPILERAITRMAHAITMQPSI